MWQQLESRKNTHVPEFQAAVLWNAIFILKAN
jgi:hypothetical protein